MKSIEGRRPLKSRGKEVFQKLSRGLIKIGLTPNQVSILSVFFALVGVYGFYLIHLEEVLYGCLLALFGIQFRLFCNLMDGLMAVEGQLSSPVGELYNDIPDRISDWFLFLGSGFALQGFPYGWELVWTASTLAILTAYVRVLGASQAVGHDFGGPAAKQQRMAILSLGILGTLVEYFLFKEIAYSLYTALVVITLGSLLTLVFRIRRISKKIYQKT